MGGKREGVLAFWNDSSVPQTLENGQMVAVGYPPRPGMVLERRGVDPSTGKSPGILIERNGALQEVDKTSLVEDSMRRKKE